MKFSKIIIFLVLISCNSKEETLILKIESIKGLSNNSKIILDEDEIGKFKINPNQSYAEIIIKPNKTELAKKIPIDSKLQISEFSKLNIVKTKLILGKSNTKIKVGDSLSWFITDEDKELEKMIMVGDFLFTHKNKDSLNKSNKNHTSR